MKRIGFVLTLIALTLPRLSLGQSAINILTLDFEGLKNGEAIHDYYNGGMGNLGSGPGPNYGIIFQPNAEALTAKNAGGTGNFANEPSPNNACFFTTGNGDVMNVPGGFTDGFSFYYTAALFSGTVTVWSGPDGTGTMLGSIFLPVLGSNNPPVNDIWAPIGVAFAGTAQSVNFSGTADYIAFDNITLGSASPINSATPAPSSLLIAVFGAAAGAGWLRRRRAS